MKNARHLSLTYTRLSTQKNTQPGTGASVGHLDACALEAAASGFGAPPARVRRELEALPARVKDGMARRTPASIVAAAARLLAAAPAVAGDVPVAKGVRI